VRTLQDTAFEVIILDMSLPDADGTEVLREIRAEIPHVPVLALSGMMVNGMETAARAAGEDAT
jgi:CheY-like chemotaxis protein